VIEINYNIINGENKIYLSNPFPVGHTQNWTNVTLRLSDHGIEFHSSTGYWFNWANVARFDSLSSFLRSMTYAIRNIYTARKLIQVYKVEHLTGKTWKVIVADGKIASISKRDKFGNYSKLDNLPTGFYSHTNVRVGKPFNLETYSKSLPITMQVKMVYDLDLKGF